MQCAPLRRPATRFARTWIESLRCRLGVTLLVSISGVASAQPAGSSQGGESERIVCASAGESGSPVCYADLPIYIGWRVYNAHCASCHADDALGSTFAPDLTRRTLRMQRRDFVAAMDNGYLGPNAAMPPRGANEDVARYYEELWAYLSARTSGELPPGSVEPAANGE
jgi:mono/diheme cytochrome c family protein